MPGDTRAGAVQAAGERREISSAELFSGRREIHIRHAGDVYTLRQTSKGKLILTK
jgi:hemin uptake protein HemP